MMRTAAIEDLSVCGKLAGASVSFGSHLSTTVRSPKPCMAGADSQQVGRFEPICEGTHVPMSPVVSQQSNWTTYIHASPLQSL
jgi:hypothetical protein